MVCILGLGLLAILGLPQHPPEIYAGTNYLPESRWHIVCPPWDQDPGILVCKDLDRLSSVGSGSRDPSMQGYGSFVLRGIRIRGS